MENFTEPPTNFTSGCFPCRGSPIFLHALLPYDLISLPASAWVLWLMTSSPAFLTDKMEVFGFNLVLTELLYVLTGLLLLTSKYFPENFISTAVFLVNSIFIARLQFQWSISTERYFAVVHPVLFLRYKPLRYRVACAGFIWLDVVLFSIAQLLLCRDHSLVLYMPFLAAVFGSICFFCVSVLRALNQPAPGSGGRDGGNRMKKKAFQTVLMNQVTTFLGYVPFLVMYCLNGKMNAEVFCIWYPVAYCLLVWLGLMHPLLYLCRAWKTPGVMSCMCE